MFKGKLHGVTLAELLVVIAIIVIMSLFVVAGVNVFYIKLFSINDLKEACLHKGLSIETFMTGSVLAS